MKNISLVLPLILFCTSALAQQQKPTGGCGFRVSVTELNSSSQFILYNDSTYTFHAIVKATGCDGGYGSIEIKIAGLSVAKLPAQDVGYYYETPLELNPVKMPPNAYPLRIIYADSYCGIFWDEYWITVKDKPLPAISNTPSADTTQIQNASVQQTNNNDELVIYPVPSKERNIHIEGLRESEHDYQLIITNTSGQKMEITDVTRYGSALIIPTGTFPAGDYTVSLTTSCRNIKRKIEILR